MVMLRGSVDVLAGIIMDESIDIDSLFAFGIPNTRLIYENQKIIGVRGQTLSAHKRRWLLKRIKAIGIDTIIDLRAGDRSDHFHIACEEAGLECFYFPVDRFRTPTTVIISNLPEFIKTINNGRFYISCALGLHRTDIALSLHYIFDPNVHEPPILYGHIRDGKLWYDDIFQRAGSIYNGLTENDKHRLGWDESLASEYLTRKKTLITQQKILQLPISVERGNTQ